MASLRPHGYHGGTLYTSAKSSSKNGYALYYDGWFNECGWAALFYNNTGKDIIVTELKALAGANPSGFKAKFECSDIGTSIPNTVKESSLTDVARVSIPYCGSTVSSWVSAKTNIKITKGHYFIVGLRSTDAGPDHWFNLARTGNDPKVCPYNCYFMQKNSSNGATTWTRDYSSIWRYQTPEILVEYKDAAIQVYFTGNKTSVSDSFYMGAVKSYTLTNCNSTKISKTNNHIGAAISSDKKILYVWANLKSETQTDTITVYGYNSSAKLNITAYPSKIIDCNITSSILKPGQSSNFSYSHEGVADNSSTSYDEYGNTDPIGQTWRVDYDQIEILNNPNERIINVDHAPGDNSGTITFNAVTDESNSVPDESVMTITARVATDYNNNDIYRFPEPEVLAKSDTVKFKHWLASDINVSLNQNLLRLSLNNSISLTNSTNLVGDPTPSNEFNCITVSFDSNDELSNYLAFKKSDGSIETNNVVVDKDETVEIIITEDIPNSMSFIDEHIINIKLTNDVVVKTTLKFKTALVYNFDFIYPKNITWEPSEFLEEHSIDSVIRETIAKLPVYRTGKKEDSQNISVFNYPIQIQMPTLKQGDTANASSTPDFKLSLDKCYVTLNNGDDVISINSATLSRYDSAINASGHDTSDKSANERLILINCDIPISADNIKKPNLAEITEYGRASDDVVFNSNTITPIIYSGDCSGIIFISFSAINNFATSSSIFNAIDLIDEFDNVIGETIFMESGVLGYADMPIKHEINLNLDDIDRDTISIRIKLYNSDDKSINTIVSLSDIVVNNLTNDDVPGILLTDDYSMVLNLILTRVNDAGEENIGNSASVKYNPVCHTLKINCNVFNECDLTTDRTNQKIQYKNQTIVNDETGEKYSYMDYTLRRAICDASRIGYMYGRLLTDETLIESSIYDADSPDDNIVYSDNFEAIDSHFINPDKLETDTDYGLPLSDSRLYLDSLLGAMNDLLQTIKTSEKCKSDQSLKDKLKTPRRVIALGYPIMWDDIDILDSVNETLNSKYENNLTLKNIFTDSGYDAMSEVLSERTASPFKELINCVSSFQDSIPLANVMTIDEDGKECPVLFYDNNNTYENNDDDRLYTLGIIDY